jgi:acetylornithine deacetylase/succinyl-diaminopimelate desuccinylase-like protein
VYGEVLSPGATRTLVFYAHYDGQPVNPAKWAEGLSPFKPQLTTAALDKDGKFIDIPPANSPLNDDWRLYLPTLNINGIESANVGRLASNIIPTLATVTLDLRLVKGSGKN